MINITKRVVRVGWLLGLWLSSSSGAEKPMVTETIQGVGYVEPVGQVLRLNFKHPGILKECLVHFGQHVKQGDVLALQSNAEEQALLTVDQAAATLAKAELQQLLAGVNPARIRAQEAIRNARQVDYDFAKLQVQRLEHLAEKQAIALNKRDLAASEAKRGAADVQASEEELRYLHNSVRPSDRTVAEARVKMAEAQVQLRQAQLAETVLHAPNDGTVLEVLRHTGDTTDSTEPVVLFGDLSRLQVRAELDENYALQLRVGQRATLHGRGFEEQTIEGVIAAVKPIMGKKTVFARTAVERKDVDVRQVLIELPAGTDFPIGLETDVVVHPDKQ